MNMHLGVSCYMLDPVKIAESFSLAAEMLELSMPIGGVAAAQQLRDEVLVPKNLKSVVSVLLMPENIVFDGGAELVPWEVGLEQLSILDPIYLRLVGCKKDVYDDKFIERIQLQIKQILPEAEKRGLTLAYENHGEPLDVIQKILDNIPSDSFKILLDPGNSFRSHDDPEMLVDTLLPRTAYLHVKDVYYNESGSVVDCVVGDGTFEWTKIIPKLKAANRDFIYLFELPSYKGDSVEGFRRSMENFQAMF